MYEVTLTQNEIAELARVAREYRENFDDYPGSQMILTNKADFAEAANCFLAAFGDGDVSPLAEAIRTPRPSMNRLEIEIRKTSDGEFHILCGSAIGVLATIAVCYEVDMVEDSNLKSVLRSITKKFLDQPHLKAASAR